MLIFGYVRLNEGKKYSPLFVNIRRGGYFNGRQALYRKLANILKSDTHVFVFSHVNVL